MTNSSTHTSATSKGSAPPSKKTAPLDAIALLKADHDAVEKMFGDYEKARSKSVKKTLVNDICTALTVHTQIEEELFYPAVQMALKDKMLIPEAIVEHEGIKELIAQIQGIEPDGDMFDAKVMVLSEYVSHHVKEEQTDMFPKAKASSVDMTALGEQMAARKQELMAQALVTS